MRQDTRNSDNGKSIGIGRGDEKVTPRRESKPLNITFHNPNTDVEVAKYLIGIVAGSLVNQVRDEIGRTLDDEMNVVDETDTESTENTEGTTSTYCA